MDKVQKKAGHANLPIKYTYMDAIATRYFQATQVFPIDREAWGKFPVDQQMWKAFKKPFLAAHQLDKCTQMKKNAHGVSFGSENTATRQQNTSAEVLPAVEAYMEKIAAAETTNHATLDVLVASNPRLSVTTKKPHERIESLQTGKITLWASGNSGGGGGNNECFSADREKQLIPALKKGW